jgi:fructokinase
MLEGFDYATLVKISDEELEFLTGGRDVSSLWRDNLKLICVTHGFKGASIHLKDGRTINHGGYAVHAVDTTGAGDSFVAGMLTGIYNHLDDYEDHLADILQFANGVGALATQQKGAIPALPSHVQVAKFIASHGKEAVD